MSRTGRPVISDIRDRILELAARESGMHSSDMAGYPSAQITARCAGMVTRGILFRAIPGPRKVRFFTSEEAAKRCEAEARAASKHTRNPCPPQPAAYRGNAAWTPDSKAVITANTKFTVCPGYRPRFEAITTPFVHTANQSGRVTRA